MHHWLRGWTPLAVKDVHKGIYNEGRSSVNEVIYDQCRTPSKLNALLFQYNMYHDTNFSSQ